MRKTKETQNGITLIALIITIIVMLILVVVTINMAINGGLFANAKEGANKTSYQVEREKLISHVLDYYDETTFQVDLNAIRTVLLSDNRSWETPSNILGEGNERYITVVGKQSGETHKIYITGNIEKVVQENSPEPQIFNITVYGSCFTLSNNSSTITEGASYYTQITPDEGYEISEVSMIIGDGEKTSSYYDSQSQSISIPSVTGDLHISIQTNKIPDETPTEPEEVPEGACTITYDLDAIEVSDIAEWVWEGDPYYTELTTSKGWKKAIVQITMGEEDITESCWDSENHIISIDEVTDNLVIYAHYK